MPTARLPLGPTGALLLAGLVLPNALFLVAFLLDMGMPPRTLPMIGYLLAAWLLTRYPAMVPVTAYLAILAADMLLLIASNFNLTVEELVAALDLVAELDLLGSPAYLGSAAAVLVSAALSMAVLAAWGPRMRLARPLPVLTAALALISADLFLKVSPHYHFGHAFAAQTPVQPATRTAGLWQPDGRNVLLVIVEGLGHLADPAQRAFLLEPLTSPALQNRYDITQGSTAFFGSTTAAEMRELCATRSFYADTGPEVWSGCLPRLYAERGYRTAGRHGFGQDMFERKDWWPLIGLQDTRFHQQLAGMPTCGATFRGVCDPELADQLKPLLSDPAQPSFVYFLTLNTHIPLELGVRPASIDCGTDQRFQPLELCQMAGLWRDLFDRLAALAADPALAPTHILLVGDHTPPFWSRRARDAFVPGEVSWISLRWKSERSPV